MGSWLEENCDNILTQKCGTKQRMTKNKHYDEKMES